MDGGGNVYVTGQSQGGWAQPGDGDPVRPHSDSVPGEDYQDDAFAAKFFPDGTLDWYTFLGGPGNDGGYGITVDDDGYVYVTGASDDYAWAQDGDGDPVRAHSVSVDDFSFDAFAARLLPNGVLDWYTFLGGNSNDYGYGVAVDNAGYVYVAGGSVIDWGGSPVREHSGGEYDVFAARLDADDGSLTWHTFLGGSGEECPWGYIGIAVDGAGVYVTSSSSATWGDEGDDDGDDAPIRAYSGADDAFAAKLHADDGDLAWHTFLGGINQDLGGDYGCGIAVHEDGNVYVAGWGDADWNVEGDDDPVSAYSGGDSDGFVAKLDADGNLTWHTFLGGSDSDAVCGIALDAEGNAYVTGVSCATWGEPEQAPWVG